MLPMACVAQTPEGTPAAPATGAPATEPTPAAPSHKITYSSCHVDGPFIAMTFDDGPHVANTPRLLDMLKERHIHATFFMCGENVVQYPALLKRMVAEGHEVANHSWNHPQLNKMKEEAVRSQLQRTHDAIVAACGVKPVLMRPPYGAFTEPQQRWSFGEFGYKCILWDVDPLDWKVRNAAHVESEILKQTVAGSIVLSHDIHKTTIDAMPATLDALAAKGFKFVTVSELIEKDRPVPPKPKATPAGKKGAATPAPATPAPHAEPAAPATPPAPAAPAPAPAAPTVTLPPALRGSPR
jgi:peptidoglycan/xylan/chitin deacetylase (PgdA/CDA1 family)